MEVDEDHQTGEAPGEASLLTGFDGSGDNRGNKKLLDFRPNGKPARRAVKELVGALSGYA